MISVHTALFLFAAALALSFHRRPDRAELHRALMTTVSFASLVCVVVQQYVYGVSVSPQSPLYGLLLLEIVVVCVAAWALPRRVLALREAPLLLALQGILLEGLITENLWTFVAVGIAGAIGVTVLAETERRRRHDDPWGDARLKLYVIYRLVSLTGLVVFAASLLQSATAAVSLYQLSNLPVPVWGRSGLTIALMSSLAIFPLHGWFPLFMSAPRLNMLTPIFVQRALIGTPGE